MTQSPITVSTFPTVTVGYSTLCNVLMHGLDAPIYSADLDRMRPTDDSAATMRAVAMLVTGTYSDEPYRLAFYLIRDMHLAGEVAGTIAFRLLSEYGHMA